MNLLLSTDCKKSVNVQKKGRLYTPFLQNVACNPKCIDCIWYKEFKVKNKYIDHYGVCKKFNMLSCEAVNSNKHCSKKFDYFTPKDTKENKLFILLQTVLCIFPKK
jgi:hypothetical protein